MIKYIKLPTQFFICICLFVSQSVIADDIPIPTEPLLGNQKKIKSSKLHGNLQKLQADWITHQSNRQAGAFVPPDPAIPIKQEFVVVDIVVLDNTDALQAKLQALGMRNLSVYGRIISGEIPISSLDKAAALKELRSIRSAYSQTRVGDVTSQGDAAMTSDLVKTQLGIDGSGVTIGTLSDSYNCLGGASTDVTSGDLPVGVTVLDDTACPGTDEGRAMMQLITDVAPGAGQAFHTASNGQADFANGILELANTAGANVIVDDVFYFAEPFFQDGIIAQAINQVVASGVSYFSSAGNSAANSYESQFRSSGSSVLFAGSDAHDFDPGAGVDVFQEVTVPLGATVRISMQWDQPFASVSGAGSTNDIDIALLNASGTTIVAESVDGNVNKDPLEILIFENTTASTSFNLVIEKFSGSAPLLMKYISFSGLSISEYNTASSTVVGHANASQVISVGAAFYQDTPAFGTNPPVLEPFSSMGGTPILFDIAGNPVNLVRNKPDIVAPDGTNTTFFGSDVEPDGFPNFFGTSAAAPHAAAAAALMLEFDNTFTPSDIISRLESTAIDMDGSGFDFKTGHGLIDVEAALAVVSAPAAATLISPSGMFTGSTPTYTWNAVSNSTWYYLWVNDTTGTPIKTWYTAAQAGCTSGMGTCSVTPSTALSIGNAKWWIQTWNSTATGPWSAAMNFSVTTRPPAVTLISPTGMITDTTPTYSWNAVSNSSWYYLWVNDSTGTPIKTWYTAAQVGCTSGTGVCSVTPSVALANGNATWWIQTWNSVATGPWSSAMNFNVAATPPAATLISPTGTIADTTPTYNWNAVSNSSWYYLWVNDSTGTPIKTWYTAAQVGCASGTGTCSVTPSTALANGNATWWIQTWNTIATGPWSAAMTFTIN
jgi:hypothetical protein